MDALNVNNYDAMLHPGEWWWRDSNLSTVEVTRAFKAWLRTHDDRIANLANLLDDNGASEIIEHTSTGKRIKVDAQSIEFLDTWVRHTLISSWGNDPLPRTSDEEEGLRIIQIKYDRSQSVKYQKEYTKKEAVALVQAREDKFHLERSKKEKKYIDFWRSVGTDIYIFLATHYMKEYNKIKWGIESRKTRSWSNRIPYLSLSNASKAEEDLLAYPVMLLHYAINNIIFYRDGDCFSKTPNTFLHRFNAVFFPVLDCWERLHNLNEISIIKNPIKTTFPDVPHTWIRERDNNIKLVRERLTAYPIASSDAYSLNLLLSNKKHLRESGSVY